MNFFRRKNPKPKDPNVALAESIVKTVLSCHLYHLPEIDIVRAVAGYLDMTERAIRASMKPALMNPEPYLKEHFDKNIVPGTFQSVDRFNYYECVCGHEWDLRRGKTCPACGRNITTGNMP